MRVEKVQLMADVTRLLDESAFVYMVSYKGLKVKQFEEIRRAFASAGARCVVLKNRVVRKAAELKGHAALAAMPLEGDTAFVSGKGDAAAVAKLIVELSKKFERLAVKGGWLEGAALKPADVESVATLPPRDALRAQLLGLLQAPASNLAGVLAAKLRSVVNVLNAYQGKLEEKKP